MTQSHERNVQCTFPDLQPSSFILNSLSLSCHFGLIPPNCVQYLHKLCHNDPALCIWLHKHLACFHCTHHYGHLFISTAHSQLDSTSQLRPNYSQKKNISIFTAKNIPFQFAIIIIIIIASASSPPPLHESRIEMTPLPSLLPSTSVAPSEHKMLHQKCINQDKNRAHY